LPGRGVWSKKTKKGKEAKNEERDKKARATCGWNGEKLRASGNT